MSGSNGNPYAGLGLSDYVAAAQRLLPRGLAWTRDPASTLTKLITAISASFARLHAAISDLTEVESDPTQAVELLPDWERSYGLPDPCSPPNATVPMRQAALAARISSQGGQSPGYYIGVAASLGYEVTIDEFYATRAGRMRAGGRILSLAWESTWRVNAPDVLVYYARAGSFRAGSAIAIENSSQLGCVLNRIKPAHTTLLMNLGTGS